MWMGGLAPLGYEVRDRKLVVNEVDAKLVRSIFQRFLKTGSTTTLARELVMHQGVGQSADEVWRALQVQQPQSQTPEPTAPEPVPEPPLIFVPRSVSSLVFGQDVPQVVPLGLAQCHQSHVSNRVSPAAKVLLRPSVTSRIDVVPPARHMIPVCVLPSP